MRVMSWLRRVFRTIWRAIQSFVEDQALTHSAAVAFYTVLSLAPILVLLLWVSSGLGPEMQQQLVDHLAALIGQQGVDVVETVIASADTDVDIANLAGWISVGTVLVSATAVFAQLQVALNTVWAVRPRPAGLGILAWLRKRLLSLGLILSLGFLLLVSLVASSALSAMMHTLRTIRGNAELLWRAVDLVVPFGVYFVVFMALFRYIPDAKLRWRHVAFGGVVTAALFVLGKFLIGLYLGTSAIGSTYGAAGSLALMLVWSYYSAAIVLFGAELTQAHVREKGERIRPEEHAERERQEHTKRATELDRARARAQRAE